MRTMKKLLALLLVVCMLLGVMPAAFAAPDVCDPFTDVQQNSWYHSGIHYALEQGLMNGTAADRFSPDANLTRGMVATVLHRAAEKPAAAGDKTFPDVEAGKYYTEAALWAAEAGIVTGYTDGTFRPLEDITREQIATMLYRYAKANRIDLSGSAELKDFPDAANAGNYAVEALKWAVGSGIINGVKNSTTGEILLQPKGTATRAQFATMLARMMALPEVPLQEVTVFYTNDVHTYIDQTMSYAAVAAVKDEYEAAGKNVLLVDAGDHTQGTAYGAMDEGETIMKLMKASGYDLATLGNHEFDYGMKRALEFVDSDKYGIPYVSCNFYHEKDGVVGDAVLDAYKVFDFNGTRIAFVGITTPESFTKSTPAYFQDENGKYIYGIAGGTDGAALYEAVQKAVDAASKEADYVIALGHCGDDPSSKPWTSEEVIANTTGLDAFIDGHSHSTVPMREVKDKDGETVVLTQTGSYFDALGVMTIAADGTIKTDLTSYSKDKTTGNYTLNAGLYEGTALPADKAPEGDADVAKLQNDWITAVNTQLGEVIGHSDVVFDNYAEGNRLVRKQETNTGDFAADALYYQFDKVQGLDVDVAIMNGGGVRNKAITGDLTYLSCKDIHTFGNVACLIEVTGQQLLDALEWGAKDANVAGTKECGGFLQVSGATYDIYVDIPSTVQKDEKGVWTGGPTGAYRVRNVKIGGEPLDLNATYRLAGYNYTLRDLGDGFAMFTGSNNILDYVKQDYMVLADYIKSFPVDETTKLPTIKADNGVYGADYSQVTGEGRINIVVQPLQ